MTKTITVYYTTGETDFCFACSCRLLIKDEKMDLSIAIESEQEVRCDNCNKLIPETSIQF